MGQPITPATRLKLQANPFVRELTEEHIITIDGYVLDPQEFVMEVVPYRFILKLLQCRCLFSKHAAGTHVLVYGRLVCYAGGRKDALFEVPAWCRRGRWVCEEQVQPAVIVKPVTNKGARR